MQLMTPREVHEQHPFNTDDGKTQYGSILAPTYAGKIINVSYVYELRVWHHASFGSDSLSMITIPVTVACPEGGNPLSASLSQRRNSGGMQRNQTENFLNDMLAPQSQAGFPN